MVTKGSLEVISCLMRVLKPKIVIRFMCLEITKCLPPLRVQFTLYSKVISVELTVGKYFNIFRGVRIWETCYKKGK